MLMGIRTSFGSGSGTQALFSVFLWCARRTPCSFFIGYNSFQQRRSAALMGRLTKGISAFGAVLFEQSGSCQDLDEAIQVIKKACLHHCKPVKTGFSYTSIIRRKVQTIADIQRAVLVLRHNLIIRGMEVRLDSGSALYPDGSRKKI